MTTAQSGASTEERQDIDPRLRRLAVVVLLGAIMTILDTTIINVAVHTLGRSFDASLSTIQWVVTGYTLALSMAIPLTGWSVRRFGARTMWLTALGLFAAGSLLCGVAWSAPSLIAFRVLQGLGGGMLLPVGQTMLAQAAGLERMGRVMSIVSVPAMLAPVLGPLLGGVIVDDLSWRWLFYVNLPFSVIALVAAVRMLPRDTERVPGARLDVLGIALLSPGLAALVYGLSEAGNGAGPGSVRVLLGVGGGALLIALFAVHASRKGDSALIDLRLLRSRPFVTATSGLFLYSAAVFGLMILLPLYSQVVRGESPLEAGWLLAPLGLGAIVTMPLAGRLADRHGSRWLAAGGLALALCGALALTQAGPDTSRTALMSAIFVIGLGHGVMAPSLMAATYQGLPRPSIPGATTGANILVRIGSSIGTAGLAIVLQLAIRDTVPGTSGNLRETATAQASSQLNGAFTHTFWWATVIAAIAVIPILAVPRRAALTAPTTSVGEQRETRGA
ncbi:MDR family MFS transporter [Actinomadura rugatobispora]|uniref:MDR family MFS transporter n=1 Tax=Actinomadura rugatobispora TaxID=1994 RepID=A0ABW1A650_9ACTN|nr:MDR family MFS transporter [Actinomadura rugatobispora]